VALRNSLDRVQDVLFTDAPGEWFERWASNKNDPDAEGARWISHHADSFMLVVDCEALAGSHPGIARAQLKLLLLRLADEARFRRVAVIWAKSDIAIPETLRADLAWNFGERLPYYREFKVSAYPSGGVEDLSAGFLEAVTWLLSVNKDIHVWVPRLSIKYPDDPFLRYGQS
jgi:hypothetical protein